MNQGEKVVPEIMLPLVMMGEELKFLRELGHKRNTTVQKEKDCSFDYLVGAMIELPRAAFNGG